MNNNAFEEFVREQAAMLRASFYSGRVETGQIDMRRARRFMRRASKPADRAKNPGKTLRYPRAERP
jgi:hypothetical protein